MINKQIPKKFSSCFLLLVLLMGSICCDSSRKKEPRLIRVIDYISEENIVQSPLKKIIEKFNFVEEDITAKWAYLPDLSSQDQEIWGTSSGCPILGNHESEFPEGMKLLNNGQEVKYLSGNKKQKTGWRWIGTSESLDLRKYDGYDKTRRGIILNNENSFKFEKLFPEGELILDLHLVNPDWENIRPSLTVTFNDSDAEELVITRKQYFRIRKKLDMGRYSIEIKFSEKNEQDFSKSSIALGLVKMTGSSDILLLTQPRQQERLDPQGEFTFQYYTYVALPKKKIRVVKPEIRYLYNIRNKFPLYDSGTESNPFSLKKKITFNEYAYNCLIAPPESEFKMDLSIPHDAKYVLEFGYGILNEFKNRVSDRPIHFRLLVEQSNEEKTLFSKTIDWETTKDIIQEKIDLGPYAGSMVRLSFQTKNTNQGDEKENSPPIMPVWANPVIYQVQETDHTNIILISLDTVRPDHLGCYGYQRNTSPAIDRLASDSVLFENAYSTTSWTLPGHVSLLTSLDCRNHQVYFPLQKMNPDTPTLADILRAQQFYCAAFTGGGYLSETYGFSKGFDSYQEIRLHGDQAIRLDEAERLAQLATRWLEDNEEKKFFLFLHTYQPHDPYANHSSIGKEFLEKKAEWEQVKLGSLLDERGGRFYAQFSEEEKQNIIALYDGDIKHTDTFFVLPIIDKLKELGLYKKSLIILTSDHGEEFFDHEAWLHDHSVYEEGIRIPLTVKFPDAEYKGSQIENIVRITDIVPTILDQLRIKTNEKQFDGISLFPLIKGKEKMSRTFVSDIALREFTMAPSVISINKDNFKFILNKKISSPYIERLVRNFDGSQIELYDLGKDPKETKNLAANIAYRDLCFQLLDNINRLYEQTKKMEKGRDEVMLDQSLRERLKALGYIK
ncbi:MAG: sulfatase [Candidatus Aminicenantes bacterium]|nr:MAG: sulfatase [Candidatus Aminicenantes bacterium]